MIIAKHLNESFIENVHEKFRNSGDLWLCVLCGELFEKIKSWNGHTTRHHRGTSNMMNGLFMCEDK
jgi:hypothetical protein